MHVRRLLAPLMLGIALAWPARGEPLAPPGGSVQATGATQIFELPFTIVEPGSYRLARDIVMTAPGTGIDIQASGVTLDLGGHVLDGDNVGGDAIFSNSTNDVTIRNGSIANWLGSGVIGPTSPIVVEDMQFRMMGGNAIALFFSSAQVRRCAVESVSVNGVAVGEGSLVENVLVDSATFVGFAINSDVTLRSCHAKSCGDVGFNANARCTFVSCTSFENQFGMELGEGSLVDSCDVSFNASGGLRSGAHSVLLNVLSKSNTDTVATASVSTEAPFVAEAGAVLPWLGLVAEQDQAQGGGTGPDRGVMGAGVGLEVGIGSIVRGCNVRFNFTDGIVAGDDSVVVDCVSYRNFSTGILAGADVQVLSCTSNENGSDGILTGDDCVVRHSVSNTNQGSGIVLVDDGTAEHCMARGNVLDGIASSGSGVRIDSNHVASNMGVGIRSTSAFAVIVRNVFTNDTLNHIGGQIGPTNDLTNP